MRTQEDIYVHTTLWYMHGEIKAVLFEWAEGEKELPGPARHLLKPKCEEKRPEVETAVKLVVSLGIPDGAIEGYGSLERWKVG